MPTYVVPMNIVLFLGAFWSAVVYGLWTRDLLGAALCLTGGFACLTSRRLTPSRPDDK